MSIQCKGHNFVNHKSEEMICWDCGFVIWKCNNESEVLTALQTVDGLDFSKQDCPGKWHGWDYKKLMK